MTPRTRSQSSCALGSTKVNLQERAPNEIPQGRQIDEGEHADDRGQDRQDDEQTSVVVQRFRPLRDRSGLQGEMQVVAEKKRNEREAQDIFLAVLDEKHGDEKGRKDG